MWRQKSRQHGYSKGGGGEGGESLSPEVQSMIMGGQSEQQGTPLNPSLPCIYVEYTYLLVVFSLWEK